MLMSVPVIRFVRETEGIAEGYQFEYADSDTMRLMQQEMNEALNKYVVANAADSIACTVSASDYDLQNQIITFFTNNPGAEPELFREFANSLGIDPDELQFQANILLTQLIQIYLQDAESMGYGDALTTDDEIDPEIIRLVSEE